MATLPALRDFEHRLKELFDQIDHELEDRYGDRYTLHPVRPRQGVTNNPSHDGLFNIGAKFTAGFGSEHGKGYVIDVMMATLEDVPDHIRATIAAAVAQRVRQLLPQFFPDRELVVEQDKTGFKIIGDLSLGYWQ